MRWRAPDAARCSPMNDRFVAISGGDYQIGSDRHYPEERPARTVDVAAFDIATAPVTNADFARFVAATGHVTIAEHAGASAVFVPTPGPVALHDPAAWWHTVKGAWWREPEGPGSTINTRQDHPVVHVAQADAAAYAAWAGARLPDEAEWEAAARAWLIDADYAWGDHLLPDGQMMANFWTGSFPWYHDRQPLPGTTPVGHFPADARGLIDMIGNVWEWTTTAAAPAPSTDSPAPRCCAPDASTSDLVILKGGSFLCAAEYCQRYRPAARIAVGAAMTSAHIGFRLARSG